MQSLTTRPTDVPAYAPLSEESPFPTPWALTCACSEDAPVYLTQEAHAAQDARPDWRWVCPRCGHFAELDTINLQAWYAELAMEARADYEWELRQAR